MQEAVRMIQSLGPLPSEQNAAVEVLERWEEALNSIKTPVTDEEAEMLCGFFGPDLCFGLGWTMLHIVETAPGWLSDEALLRAPTEWAERLRTRYQNSLGDEKDDS